MTTPRLAAILLSMLLGTLGRNAHAQDPTAMLVGQLQQLGQTFAPGSAPIGAPLTGALPRGAVQDFFVNLQPGVCYTAVAAGSISATDVDLYMWDPTGRRVATDRERDNMPHLTYCATLPGPHRLQVKMFRGEGIFAAGIFQLAVTGGGPVVMQVPAPPAVVVQAPAPFAPVQVAPAPGADYLTARLGELAATFAPGQTPASQVFSGALPRGGRQDFLVALGYGHCYTAIAVATAYGRDLDLRLWDPNGRRVAADTRNDNFPHVQHCATLPGPHRVQVEMNEGQGPFVMQVFGQ